MKEVILLLGGNLGDRRRMFEAAREKIAARAGCIIRRSSLYESEAWGFASSHFFLNQVVIIATRLGPVELMELLLGIEGELGKRSGSSGDGYTSRVIDIDMLFYADRVMETGRVTVPHPRLHRRRFTLVPLAEVAPDFVHPVFQKSVARLLEECDDPSKVYRVEGG